MNDIALKTEILDIHDRIADVFESHDPPAAEAIRQAARMFIENTDMTMDEVFDMLRALASADVRAALHRAQDYLRRIAREIEPKTRPDR